MRQQYAATRDGSPQFPFGAGQFSARQTRPDNSSQHLGPLRFASPFLDQMTLFKSIDFTKTIDDPANSRSRPGRGSGLLLPSDTNRLTDASDPLARAAWAKNNYRGNGGNDTANWIRRASKRTTVSSSAAGGSASIKSPMVPATRRSSPRACWAMGDNNVVSNPGDWFVVSPTSHSP